MSDEHLGDDSKPRSYDVTFLNPLFDFNDDYTLCHDNPLFDEELEDIKIPSDESKVHIQVLSVLWGNRLPIPDGSLLLSRYGYIKNHKKIVKNGQTRTRETEEHKRSQRCKAKARKSQKVKAVVNLKSKKVNLGSNKVNSLKDKP
ncbi:hypothetical protein Tco_1216540 [Tanacetum coccineum]